MPSAAEHRRALPSASQRLLPLESVDQSDGAYLEEIANAAMPDGCKTLLFWMVRNGERRDGYKVIKSRSQRELAKRLMLSPSTVCESLRRLKNSGLIIQADGEIRLRLSWLVEVSQASAEVEESGDPPTVDEALAALGARQRSAAPVPVRENFNSPVARTVSVTVPSPGQAQAAERSASAGTLKGERTWQRLQSHHFRPRLDVPALRKAFETAAELGLIASDRDGWIRFLATAHDLSNTPDVRSVQACLRSRVERNSCFRLAEESHAWAKSVVRREEMSGVTR